MGRCLLPGIHKLLGDVRGPAEVDSGVRKLLGQHHTEGHAVRAVILCTRLGDARRVHAVSWNGTAIHQRQTVAAIMNQFMAKYDLLLTPTMPMTAFAVNENAAWGGDGVDIGWTPFTLAFNLTRQPAATRSSSRSRKSVMGSFGTAASATLS